MKLPFSRLSFGLALPGDHCEGKDGFAVFVETYPKQKDAQAHAARISGHVTPYLYGRFKRGWTVLGFLTDETQIEKLRQGYDVPFQPFP